MKRLPVVALVVLAVAGCSTQSLWNLNGRTQADLEAADNQCSAYAAGTIDQQQINTAGSFIGGNQAGYGLALLMLQSAGYDARYKQCMAANGFRPIP